MLLKFLGGTAVYNAQYFSEEMVDKQEGENNTLINQCQRLVGSFISCLSLYLSSRLPLFSPFSKISHTY